MDLENDKNHPEKKKRPLASGEIVKREAICVMIVLIAIVVMILWINGFSTVFNGLLSLYLGINVAYSLGMKNIPLVDVAILSGGYLIRVFAGGELAETGVSDWMFLTILSVALFLGFGKRRNELLRYGDKGRKILKKYTGGFLDKSIQLFLSLSIVFYALSCADKNTEIARRGISLLWTVPLVIFVLLRYNMLLEDEMYDGDPIEVLQRDKIVWVLIIFYGMAILTLMYGYGVK